jgi:hypothetical protein
MVTSATRVFEWRLMAEARTTRDNRDDRAAHQRCNDHRKAPATPRAAVSAACRASASACGLDAAALAEATAPEAALSGNPYSFHSRPTG